MALLKQVAELQIKDKIISYPDLNLEFTYSEKDDNSPSELNLIIYNLSDTTINDLDTGNGVVFKIGYDYNLGVIFEGYVSQLDSIKNGVNKLLKIKAVSSIELYSEIDVSYISGVDSKFVLFDMCDKLGYTLKSLELFKNLKFETGYSEDNIDLNSIKKIVQKCESWMAIQGKNIYIYDPRTIRTANVYQLNFTSGLLKNPTKSKEKNKRYSYVVESLPINYIRKAGIIQIESDTFNGLAQVIEISISNWKAIYKVGEIK